MTTISMLEDFEEVMLRGHLKSETAGAILVLAASIERNGTFNRSNAENFGHELALALKNVFENTSISINGRIETE
jgi:hypothetical protein